MTTRAIFVHSIPTVLTFIVLIAVAWWGHRNEWSLGSTERTAEGPHSGYWCAEHAVPEAECLLCRKSFAKEMRAKEPPAQVADGEEIRFAQLASNEVRTRAGITTMPATDGTHQPKLIVPAETIHDPTRVLRVTARMPGLVRRLGKRLGDPVAIGDVLAVMEVAEVGRMKSALMRALADQAAARVTTQYIRVAADGGFRTTGEVNEASTRLRMAEIAVFDAEQALIDLGFAVSAVDLAKLDARALSDHLRSLGMDTAGGKGTGAESAGSTAMGSANLLPIIAAQVGTVTELRVVPGEAVDAGALLAVVADTSQMMLTLAASPAQVATLAHGQRIVFATDTVSAEGAVHLIGAVADEATRLIPVHALIGNADGRLRAHQVGNATVMLGAPRPAMIVPPAAVQFDGAIAYVFIERTPTIFRGLPVKVLATTAGGVAVDRLLPGDHVAVAGSDVLKGNLFQDKFGPGCACNVE